jgi:hypothetical protein
LVCLHQLGFYNKCHILGSILTNYFSQFWRLEVQDPGPARHGVWEGPASWFLLLKALIPFMRAVPFVIQSLPKVIDTICWKGECSI